MPAPSLGGLRPNIEMRYRYSGTEPLQAAHLVRRPWLATIQLSVSAFPIADLRKVVENVPDHYLWIRGDDQEAGV